MKSPGYHVVFLGSVGNKEPRVRVEQVEYDTQYYTLSEVEAILNGNPNEDRRRALEAARAMFDRETA